jgi:hypothetical protein
VRGGPLRRGTAVIDVNGPLWLSKPDSVLAGEIFHDPGLETEASPNFLLWFEWKRYGGLSSRHRENGLSPHGRSIRRTLFRDRCSHVTIQPPAAAQIARPIRWVVGGD